MCVHPPGFPVQPVSVRDACLLLLCSAQAMSSCAPGFYDNTSFVVVNRTAFPGIPITIAQSAVDPNSVTQSTTLKTVAYSIEVGKASFARTVRCRDPAAFPAAVTMQSLKCLAPGAYRRELSPRWPLALLQC